MKLEPQSLTMFYCQEPNCGRRFTRRYDLRRHIHNLHGDTIMEKCFLCGQLTENRQQLETHYRKYHKPSRHFIVKDSAFNRNVITYRYNYLDNERDFVKAQLGIKHLLRKQIQLQTAQKIMTKISLIFVAEMSMIDVRGDRISTCSIPFRAPNFMASSLRPHVIDSHIMASFAHQRMALDQFIHNGSQWKFERALVFDLEIAKMNPLRVGSFKNVNISNLKNRRFLYNPPNKNNRCFLYCIAYFLLFGLLRLREPTRIEELMIKKKTKTFNLSKINFPTTIQDIKRFVKNNSNLDLKLNILYRGTDEIIYPLEFAIGNGTQIVNLLLVHTKNVGHFLLIKDVDKFLRKSYSTMDKKTKKEKIIGYQKIYYCLNCLNGFYSIAKRNEHTKICCLNEPRKEQVPTENEKIIKFKNYENQTKLEYIAFLDFETILPDISKKCPQCSTLKCKCTESRTDEIHEQIPVTYSLVIIGPHEEILHERTKSTHNAHVDLIKHLLTQESEWLRDLLLVEKDMVMSANEKRKFHDSDQCYLCGINFTMDVVKCRDHCHATGQYIGAACQQCNLRRRKPRYLKIFMHNASKFDMHFIIQAIAQFPEEIKNVNVLPYNGENFITLKFNCFQFLDSMSFLPTSLAQLSENLSKSNHDYPILRQTYLAQFGLDHILRKGFFPYEYCSSFELMKETKKIPKREAFYSVLNEEIISEKDHRFASKMWDIFQCENLIDYAELYCKIDTILLAEIVLAFRNKMFEFSGLDATKYISLASFGFDTMLKLTKNEIELPTDINMVHFLEQCKRGGLSFVNTRHLEVKNDANHHATEELVYLDANNLYGSSQMCKLPYKDFRWMSESEIATFDLTQNFDGDKGYFIECDLHYPKALHKTHANYPIVAEMLEVNYDDLSPYSQEAVFITQGKNRYKDIKLMTTFYDKCNYICHIKNLILYLSLGLKLIKIHKILEFSQKKLFAPYIKMTTKARQKAQNKFEMDLFKLLVSIFMFIHASRCGVMDRCTFPSMSLVHKHAGMICSSNKRFPIILNQL